MKQSTAFDFKKVLPEEWILVFGQGRVSFHQCQERGVILNGLQDASHFGNSTRQQQPQESRFRHRNHSRLISNRDPVVEDVQVVLFKGKAMDVLEDTQALLHLTFLSVDASEVDVWRNHI